MTHQRDNFKAGLFVLVGIIMALCVILSLSSLGTWFERTQQVTIYYTLSDGLKGLKLGATVTLGDMPVGEVVEISNKLEDGHDHQHARVLGGLVTVQIPAQFTIYDNAAFELEPQLLGSGTRLNIASVGSGMPYNSDSIIDGQIAKSDLTRNLVEDVGIEDLQRKQIQQIIANVVQITETLSSDLPQLTADLHDTLAMSQATLTDAKKIVGELAERRQKWINHFDQIITHADAAVSTLRQTVESKAPAMGQAVDNVLDITQHVKQNTMIQLDQALASASQAVDHLKHIATELDTLAVGQRPILERFLANGQLMSEQLKLAAIEVRRSPWRLLYKPSDDELNSDNLYDASRSFAQAASVLEATTASLRALQAHEGVDDAAIKQQLDYLQAVFLKYEAVEEAFWEALQKYNKTP